MVFSLTHSPRKIHNRVVVIIIDHIHLVNVAWAASKQPGFPVFETGVDAELEGNCRMLLQLAVAAFHFAGWNLKGDVDVGQGINASFGRRTLLGGQKLVDGAHDFALGARLGIRNNNPETDGVARVKLNSVALVIVAKSSFELSGTQPHVLRDVLSLFQIFEWYNVG